MEYRVIAKKFKDEIALTFWLDRMGDKYWELVTVKWDKKGLAGLFIFKTEQGLYESADGETEEDDEWEVIEEEIEGEWEKEDDGVKVE